MLESVLFQNPVEGSWSLPVEGEIPAFLRGTYYLAGPGRFENHGLRYQHWLDGDGLVRGLTFTDDGWAYRRRFVRTRRLLTEEEAGRPLFRAFGTRFDDDRLRFRMMLESPCNVSVFQAGDKLLAFGEQSLPWELEPKTLETKTEYDFGKSLLKSSPFSAHPKVDEQTGAFCNFGIKYRADGADLCYWEFDANLALTVKNTVELAEPSSLHDFSITRDYACFFVSPYTFDVKAFVQDGASYHESLRWRPEQPSHLLVLSRQSGNLMANLPLKLKGHCLHQVEAKQDGEGLTLKVIQTPQPLYDEYAPLPELFPTVEACSCRCIRVCDEKWEIVSEEDYPQEFHMDFPTTLNGPKRKDLASFWTLAMDTVPRGESKYYHRLLRFDWTSGQVGDQCALPAGEYFSGEPAILSDPANPEKAIAICPVWRADEGHSEIRILDAFDLKAPAQAIGILPDVDPLAFHASFVFSRPPTGQPPREGLE